MTQAQVDEAYQAYRQALLALDEADRAYTNTLRIAWNLRADLERAERVSQRLAARYRVFVEALALQENKH